MLTWGVRYKKVAVNPLAQVDFIEAKKSHRRHALEEDEIEKLLAASPAHYGRLWRALLSTLNHPQFDMS